jgi:gluconolactonase
VIIPALLAVLSSPPASALDEFYRLVSRGEKVEKLAGAFGFTEGPVWVKERGELLFSDIPNDRIVSWALKKTGPELTTFRVPSGQANGLVLDLSGRLIACEHAARRVSRTERDGTVVTLADRFEGKRLNSPNDAAIRGDGSVYFTDPPYGVREEARELSFQGVFRIAPDGKFSLLAKDFIKPNGIAFSPDGRILYVADTEGGHIRAFDVAKDGSLRKGRVFAPIDGPDGMKIDSEGHVYCTGAGGVWVFDSTGTKLGVIETPETPANCAFGGDDGRVLFVTARTGLYRVRVNVGPALPSR